MWKTATLTSVEKTGRAEGPWEFCRAGLHTDERAGWGGAGWRVGRGGVVFKMTGGVLCSNVFTLG